MRPSVTLGTDVHVAFGSRLWAPTRLTVGNDVYIGKRCTIEVDGNIGSHVLIANNVGIVGRRDHDMRQTGVPITQATWCGADNGKYLRTSVDIGPDVWIGYGAVVLAPVTIGTSAIVAAGSVVTHDVPANSIVAGNPAKVVGFRTST